VETEIAAIRDELEQTPRGYFMVERSAVPPKTHILIRGKAGALGPGVEPAAPEIVAAKPLRPEAGSTSGRRLAFAKWMTSRENPLTARVIVNRQWQALFGQGLVRTVGDFGHMGEPPSHAELLDWLACTFVEKGWSLKKLHRLIVTSATYRQSSRVAPILLAKDPQNRLLARMPRLRLDAEIVRDAALGASGLLRAKMFGPPVRPPQPAGALEGAFGGESWPTSQGEDGYRRGIYTFLRRTTPYAMFSTFDAPSGETCLASREVSNTPLQALTMLNDEVFVEAAKALGGLAARQPGTDAEKAAYLMRRCITRRPDADEIERMLQFVETERRRLAAGEIDSRHFVAAGDSPADQAIWTLLARALLNLDETISRN